MQIVYISQNIDKMYKKKLVYCLLIINKNFQTIYLPHFILYVYTVKKKERTKKDMSLTNFPSLHFLFCTHIIYKLYCGDDKIEGLKNVASYKYGQCENYRQSRNLGIERK